MAVLFTRQALTVAAAGVVLHFVLPAGLALIAAGFIFLINGTTELWWIKRGLYFFLLLQAANAFAGASAIGILADKLLRRITSWAVYPAIFLLSFSVLYSMTAIVVGIYYVFPGHRINTDLVKYSLYFSTAAAPVLSIVAILAGRRPDHLT